VDINSFVSNTKLPVLVLYGWPEYLQSYLPREGIIIMGNEANGIWKIWKS
jgi:hypothetical protein